MKRALHNVALLTWTALSESCKAPPPSPPDPLSASPSLSSFRYLFRASNAILCYLFRVQIYIFEIKIKQSSVDMIAQESSARTALLIELYSYSNNTVHCTRTSPDIRITSCVCRERAEQHSSSSARLSVMQLDVVN